MTKGKNKLSFFTMPEYEEWKKTASSGWTIKYYKGLGTSDKKEAQEYFAGIDQHRKSFVYEGRYPHPTTAAPGKLSLQCSLALRGSFS